MLVYFWDEQAGLLLVGPPPDCGIALVQVEAITEAGAAEVLGYGYFGGQGGARSDEFFAVAVPKLADGAELKLRVQAFPDEAGGEVVTDLVRLVAEPPGPGGDPWTWAVVRDLTQGADDAFFYIASYQPHEAAPEALISECWSSVREGGAIHPARSGAIGGALPLVEVEIDYRREGIGGDMPELPVEFKLTLTRPKTAIAHGETRIEAYAL
ncbi:MAG: hypothetical protein AAF914_10085, partial [Pseudomonadota bacterium]